MRHDTRRQGVPLKTAILALLLLFPVSGVRADNGCSLQDVRQYRDALLYPSQEATPDYIRRLSEDFIRRCPERPESGEALLNAASASMDSGDPLAAAAYFDDAGTRGASMTAIQQFDHARMLMAIGRGGQGQIRQGEAARTWLTALNRDGEKQVTLSGLPGGVIISVRFETGDVRALWVALPYMAGLPASVSLRADPVRRALTGLRGERQAAAITWLEHHTCARSWPLSRRAGEMTLAQAEALARAALRAYLSAPDTMPQLLKGDPLPPCPAGRQIFHSP